MRYAPAPRPRNMYPSWEIVENARTLLMSYATTAIVAEKIAVKPPIAAMTRIAVKGAWTFGTAGTRKMNDRAVRYTPALTIVAAWMRALTVVGPSIASGNHACSGNWALFPTAPPNRRSGMIVRSSGLRTLSRDAISVNRSVPNWFQMMRTPTRKRTSPTRVTMNAFLAAAAASGLWYQKPISRYEQRPMISQKMRSWRKLSALTVPS